MIITLILGLLLSICNGDVSHLDTDLQEDGYHYNQPAKPFPTDNSGSDNQLDTNGLQSNVDSPRTRIPPESKPPKPTAEYLPPVDMQSKPEPSSYPQTPTQSVYPSKEYTPSTTLTKSIGPQQSSKPFTTPDTQQTLETTKPNYSPGPQTQTPQTSAVPSVIPRQPTMYVPPPTIISQPIPNQTLRPKPSIPEREYLPPSAVNEIDSGREIDQSYITPQSSLPSQPTYSEPSQKTDQPMAPGSTFQTSFPASESTYQIPQSTYAGPTSPETYPSYLAPQPTSPVPQPSTPERQPTYTNVESSYSSPRTSYSTTKTMPSTSQTQTEEPEAAHELGPDGYKYKIPSKAFKF